MNRIDKIKDLIENDTSNDEYGLSWRPSNGLVERIIEVARSKENEFESNDSGDVTYDDLATKKELEAETLALKKRIARLERELGI